MTDAQAALLSQTYTPSGTLPPSAPVWEKQPNDAISALMADNYASTTLADRFHGLGAAALQGLLAGGDYSQSVMLRSPGSGADGSTSNLDQIRQTQLHTLADNQVTLDIKTAGGATVHLSLTSQAGGLGVQVEVTGGTLSDAERSALAGLTDAFQGAIDGLTGVPPKLALDGLTQFDSKVLTSVSLQASFKLANGSVQTLAFQADSQRRSVAYTGTAGTVNVEVDLSNPALIGSASQQSRALAAYLQQFDQAQGRGRGDAALMTMFKDAFTTLNSHYGPDVAHSGSVAGPVMPLSDTDRAMLTGLADFSASVQASDQPSPNPMRPEERDTFSYQMSQQTTVRGRGAADRAIEQSQQSRLSASYHQSLYPDTALNLTTDATSQNYYYNKIDDTASSVASIGYKDGRLVKASLVQSTRQSTEIKKYLAGKLEEDLNTPSSVSRDWDLVGLIQGSQPREDGSATEQELGRWRNTLSAIGNLALMKADPTQLRGAYLVGAKELNTR
ncbi:hypothetical protein AKI39_19140 [Bordetella sp. H567]|nr:hypothetical protein AKI39_19140 [Bordetella sp. H567]